MEFFVLIVLQISSLILLIKSLTLLTKLKTIMGAQAVTQATMEAILALIAEAFSTRVGDLTEAEATAQDAEFRARAIALLGGEPPPPTQ